MNTYTLGQTIRLSATVKDVTGTLVTPDTIIVKIKPPTGTFAPATPSEDSVGLYHLDYEPTVPGTHNIRIETTNPDSAAQSRVYVDPNSIT